MARCRQRAEINRRPSSSRSSLNEARFRVSLARSHRRGRCILLFVASSQPASLSAPALCPRLSGILSLSGRRMAINPCRSWGPGLLKLLYGSEPKSDGLRFEIPARASAHTIARQCACRSSRFVWTRVRVSTRIHTYIHMHMSSPRSSPLFLSRTNRGTVSPRKQGRA